MTATCTNFGVMRAYACARSRRQQRKCCLFKSVNICKKLSASPTVWEGGEFLRRALEFLRRALVERWGRSAWGRSLPTSLVQMCKYAKGCVQRRLWGRRLERRVLYGRVEREVGRLRPHTLTLSFYDTCRVERDVSNVASIEGTHRPQGIPHLHICIFAHLHIYINSPLSLCKQNGKR